MTVKEWAANIQSQAAEIIKQCRADGSDRSSRKSSASCFERNQDVRFGLGVYRSHPAKIAVCAVQGGVDASGKKGEIVEAMPSEQRFTPSPISAPAGTEEDADVCRFETASQFSSDRERAPSTEAQSEDRKIENEDAGSEEIAAKKLEPPPAKSDEEAQPGISDVADEWDSAAVAKVEVEGSGLDVSHESIEEALVKDARSEIPLTHVPGWLSAEGEGQAPSPCKMEANQTIEDEVVAEPEEEEEKQAVEGEALIVEEENIPQDKERERAKELESATPVRETLLLEHAEQPREASATRIVESLPQEEEEGARAASAQASAPEPASADSAAEEEDRRHAEPSAAAREEDAAEDGPATAAAASCEMGEEEREGASEAAAGSAARCEEEAGCTAERGQRSTVSSEEASTVKAFVSMSLDIPVCEEEFTDKLKDEFKAVVATLSQCDTDQVVIARVTRTGCHIKVGELEAIGIRVQFKVWLALDKARRVAAELASSECEGSPRPGEDSVGEGEPTVVFLHTLPAVVSALRVEGADPLPHTAAASTPDAPRAAAEQEAAAAEAAEEDKVVTAPSSRGELEASSAGAGKEAEERGASRSQRRAGRELSLEAPAPRSSSPQAPAPPRAPPPQ